MCAARSASVDDTRDPVRHTYTAALSLGTLSRRGGGDHRGEIEQWRVAVLLNFLLHDAFRLSMLL